MSGKRIVVCAWATALLCGCASYHPQPLSPAETARALDTRSLDDPRLQRFVDAALSGDAKPVSPVGWRLTTLTLAALYYHPDIEIAQARLADAEAAVITARQPVNPVLKITGNLGQAAVPGAIPVAAVPMTVGPIIDLVLEIAGKREARTAQARHRADAARWDLRTAAWQVRGRVRDALLDLWASGQRLVLLGHRSALQAELVQLVEHRLAAGEASALDVARERIGRGQLAFEVDAIRQQAAEARVRLATAIGVPVRGLDGVEPDLRAFDVAPTIAARHDAAAWRRRALTERSDVHADLAHYEAAQAALRLAVAGQYPDVTLSPGYNYDIGVNRYILDLGTTLPIFHQNQGPIAEALARRRTAAAIFIALQAQIIGALDEAETAYRTATDAVSVGDAMLADERHRELQVSTAFRAGQADRPTLLTARLEVAVAALSRLDAVVRQRRALGALEDALQHPLYEPDAALPPPQTAVVAGPVP